MSRPFRTKGIKSIKKEAFNRRCLHCGSILINDYGVVSIPPIDVQISDQERGIKRTYQAHRHYCSICNGLFDVIYVDQVDND